MRTTIGILMMLLVGCNREPRYVDQEKRRIIFKECLTALPAGPQQTKYNDWDDVVQACETTAYYQSLTKVDCASCLTQ
jgi:hypothetical protein